MSSIIAINDLVDVESELSWSVSGKIGLDEDEILVVFEGSLVCDAVTEGDSVLRTEVAVMIDCSVKSAVLSPELSVSVVKTNNSVSGFMVVPINEEDDHTREDSLVIPLTSMSVTGDDVTGDIAISVSVLSRERAVTEEV